MGSSMGCCQFNREKGELMIAHLKINEQFIEERKLIDENKSQKSDTNDFTNLANKALHENDYLFSCPPAQKPKTPNFGNKIE